MNISETLGIDGEKHLSPHFAGSKKSPENTLVEEKEVFPCFSPLEVFKNPEVVAAAQRKMELMFSEGRLLPDDVGRTLAAKLVGVGKAAVSVDKLEVDLKRVIDEAGVGEVISQNFDDRFARARFLSALVGPYLEGEVLDVGSGDGIVGDMIQKEFNRSVTLVDVVDIKRTELPLVIFDGESLPLPDKSQDTVLLIGSLHHGENPLSVLDEAIRVSKKRIVIIEPVYADKTLAGMLSAKFIDWMISRVMKRDDVPCPCKICSVDEWEKIFQERGLKLIEKYDFDNGNKNVSEHSWMFVVDV